MLRIAILTLLRDGAMSGYDLVKAFDRGVTYVWPAKQSQIYPSLRAMETDGVIAGRSVAQEGRPDKRTYAITAAGITELERWVVETPSFEATRDPLPLRAWNLPRLPLDDARAVLERQRLAVTERLAALEVIAAHLDERSDGVHGGARTAAELGIRVLRSQLDWCEWVEATLAATPGGDR